MKRSVVLLCTLLLLVTIPALAADRSQARASLARDVVRMWDADIGRTTILAFVRQHARTVAFTADDVLLFRDAGLSERVIEDLLDAATGASPSRRAYRFDSPGYDPPGYYPGYYPRPYPWWYYGGPYLDIHLGGHYSQHYSRHSYGYGHDGLVHGSSGGHSFSRVHLTGGRGHVSGGHHSGGHGIRSHGRAGHGVRHGGGHGGGHDRH